MPNPNHPAKGSRTTVEPIRDERAIAKIKKALADQPRDLLLFTLGVNNGLRAGDLLALTVGQVRGLKIGEALVIREGKTGKPNVLVLNKASHAALKAYLEAATPSDGDPLFRSRKGGALTTGTVNGMVKAWCLAAGLKGNYGSHSLRKTFGYHQRTRFGVGWEILAKRFNHSSPAITMRYLGISDGEVHGILLNEI